jgi:protein O-mannosyl-transferase
MIRSTKAKNILYPLLAAAVTALIWQGSSQCGFTADDYMVIHVQSPIRSFVDAISMFWRVDPNPQYWRPLTNSSVSLDFWLRGYDAGGFHQTNLILHIIATTLIYFFSKNIFRLASGAAFIIALLFGVTASHDSNLLWIAARSDVIATIMMLSTLLTAWKAERSSRKMLWLTLSYIFFFLSLCSKEVNGVGIALLPLIIYTSSPKELWQKKMMIAKKLVPYVIIAAIFLAIRMQFTVPLSDMQPLTAEGSRSIIAFAKNFFYSIGYIVAPIDFATASAIINEYLIYGVLTASVLIALAAFLLWKYGSEELFSLLYKPFVVTLVMGLVSFQSFERWRVYFPSAGVFAIFVIIGYVIWQSTNYRRLKRLYVGIFAVTVIFFHGLQSVMNIGVWRESTAMLVKVKDDIRGILSEHTERPVMLNFVLSPIKLGGAPIMQLSQSYTAIMAEAERLKLPSLAYGSLGSLTDSVWLVTSVDAYALYPEMGFATLSVTQKDSARLEVECDPRFIGIQPNASLADGVARRDRVYKDGDSVDTYGTRVKMLKAKGAFTSHATIHIKDTAGLPIYFDGDRVRVVGY